MRLVSKYCHVKELSIPCIIISCIYAVYIIVIVYMDRAHPPSTKRGID